MKEKNNVDCLICERFKQIRENKELNKSEIARKLNVLPSVISDIERYQIEPSKEVIKTLIEKFDINAHWLLTGNGEIYQTQSAQKTNCEVPATPGISADERNAIKLLRENPELFKFNQAYAKHKKKGKDAIESFVDGLQINLSLQNSV